MILTLLEKQKEADRAALDEADAHELWRETEARTLRALAESR